MIYVLGKNDVRVKRSIFRLIRYIYRTAGGRIGGGKYRVMERVNEVFKIGKFRSNFYFFYLVVELFWFRFLINEDNNIYY